MRPIPLLICLLLGTACDEKGPVGPTVPLRERFTLAPGESATVEGAGFLIQFIEVSGDSRCPADVVCIQGGDAIVRIAVYDGSRVSPYELHTGDAARASVVHDGHRVELVELRPYPFSGRAIDSSEYRAMFTVT